MKLTSLTLLLLVTASLAGAQTKRATDAQVVRELKALTRQWDEALIKKDFDKLNEILAVDFVYTGWPRTAYLGILKMPTLKYSTFKRHSITARVYGQTAVLYGRTEINGTFTGSDAFDSSSDFMAVWVKRAGRWRCVAEYSEHIRDEAAEKQDMVPIGPDVRADLVIFFKTDATHDQIENFWEETLSIKSNKGHSPRPGIRELLRLLAVQDHEGIAVTFFPNATPAQRDDIKARVKSSPLVYKVLEDVVPQDIKSIEGPTSNVLRISVAR
jgi:ketosteroid isomerase-like protein